MDNYNFTMFDQSVPPPPSLSIIEQPTSRFRYRYESEVGSHGRLMGVRNTKKNKSYPKVKVENCIGKVKLRASLYALDGDKPIRHVLKLQSNECNNDGVFERIKEITTTDSIIELSGVSIGHVGKRNISNILLDRCLENIRKERESLEKYLDQTLTDFDKNRAQKEAKELEDVLGKKLNEAIICYEAFLFVENMEKYVQLCSPVYSQIIYNRKSASTGDLKISRLSKCSGSPSGGDEIFLLCDKIDKKNIKVRFYETVDEETVWEAYGQFNENDVHHQVAIVFKTPPYRDLEIEEEKIVSMQLVRPKDDTTSESVNFQYVPDREYSFKGKKRKMNYSAFDDQPKLSKLYVPGNIDTSFASKKQGNLKLEIPGQVTDSTGASCSNAQLFDSQPSLATAEILEQSLKLQETYGPNFSATQQVTFSEETNIADPNFQNIPIYDEPDNTNPMTQSPFIYERNDVVQPTLNRLNSSVDIPDFDEISEWLESYITSRSTSQGGDEIQIDGPDKIESDSKKFKENNVNLSLYLLAINSAKALHNYARSSDVKCLLFTMRHLFMYCDDNGDNAVHLAVIHSKCDALEYMMDVYESDTDVVNHRNNLSQTPLHIAVHNDDSEIVKVLLKFRANPNIRDRRGNSAIHIAANHKNDKILKHLFSDVSRNLELVNHDGFTALHLAVMADSLQCTKLLCEYNADIDARSRTTGESALHMAVKNMNLSIVNYLIKIGADVDMQMFNGCTPLHLAVQSNSIEIVKALLLANADPYLENNEQLLNESSDEEKALTDPEFLLSENDDENRCYNSFDFAKDNEKLCQLLNGIGLENESLYYDKNPDEIDLGLETEITCPQNDLDSGLGGSRNCSEIDPIRLDIDVKRRLAKLLDPPGEKDWKILCQCLGLDEVVEKIEKTDSPTCALFEHITNLTELRNGLEALGSEECLLVIDTHQSTNKYKTSVPDISDIEHPMSKLNLRS